MNQKKRIVCFCGHSGSGKTAIAELLCAKYPKLFAKLITTTTREPRYNETNGIDYYFVSPIVYEGLNLIAKAEVANAQYGMDVNRIQDILDDKKYPLIVCTKDGAQELMEKYADTDIEVYVVAILAEKETCIMRMAERGDTQENIEKRLKRDATIEYDQIEDYKMASGVIFCNNNIGIGLNDVVDFLKETLVESQ